MKQLESKIEKKTRNVKQIYRVIEAVRVSFKPSETLERVLPKLKVGGSNPLSRSS